MNKLFFTVITAFFLIGNFVPAICENEIPEMGITELKLSNGLRVCMKDTGSGDDEIEMRLSALGGHYATPLSKRASHELCVEMGWKSGIGNFNYDELSALLYENAIDFQPAIHPYQRMVEMTTISTGIEPCLHLVQQLFTKKHFSKEVFNQVIAEKKNACACFHNDPYHTLEYTIQATNTQGYSQFCELKMDEIDAIDFEETKQFYETAFSNPEDFVLVIVGGIDPHQLIPLIEQSVGLIPRATDGKSNHKIVIPEFPKGITPKTVKVSNLQKSMACISFPVTNSVDDENQWESTMLARIIQIQLGQGVHVFLDYPFYPILDQVWLTIRYQAEFNQVNEIAQNILTELNHLNKSGPSKKVLKQAVDAEILAHPYWLRHKDYWAETLSCYYLTGRDPREIVKKSQVLKGKKPKEIQCCMQKNLNMQQYSIVSLSEPK